MSQSMRYRRTLRDHRRQSERDTYIKDLMRGLVVVGLVILALIVGMPR